jgi:hypothetical protein
VVSATVATLRSRVESVSEASLWSMSPEETAATLVELGRLSAQVAELELRVAEHAHGLALGEGRGATSTRRSGPRRRSCGSPWPRTVTGACGA